MRHLFAMALAVGALGSCDDSNRAVSQLSNENHLRAAETFIDTFYAFESAELTAMLVNATDSIPSIGFYQGWAEGGHYRNVSAVPSRSRTTSC